MDMLTSLVPLGAAFLTWVLFYYIFLSRKKVTKNIQWDERHQEDYTMVETAGAKIIAGFLACFPAFIVLVLCVYVL